MAIFSLILAFYLLALNPPLIVAVEGVSGPNRSFPLPYYPLSALEREIIYEGFGKLIFLLDPVLGAFI